MPGGHARPRGAGKHAQAFLGDWRGTRVCDYYAGYKASIAEGVTEAGCMAHVWRNFFELQEHGQSQIAGKALERIVLPCVSGRAL